MKFIGAIDVFFIFILKTNLKLYYYQKIIIIITNK